MASQSTSPSMMMIKRQVTVKTMVTETFKEKAGEELSEELKLIASQSEQLEEQYQFTLKQIEALAQQGQNVQREMEQLNREVQEKRSQLANLKIQVSANLANIGKVENGSYIVTGMLENFVDVKPGDNIYEKVRNAEIIVVDGVVDSIRG